MLLMVDNRNKRIRMTNLRTRIKSFKRDYWVDRFTVFHTHKKSIKQKMLDTRIELSKQVTIVLLENKEMNKDAK